MEDFDLMYMMKTPFYLGNFTQAVQEAPNCEINAEEPSTALTTRTLLLVRSLTASNQIDQLKQYIQSLTQDTNQSQHVQQYAMLVQYLLQKKVDQSLVEQSKQLMDADVSQVETNPIAFCLLAYHFWDQREYDNLFKLLSKTKNLEYLALKAVAYAQINRFELAEQTLKKMRAQDEDNCLTLLTQGWLSLAKSGTPTSFDEQIAHLNNVSERFSGYSAKTYNLLALTLMQKQDVDRAIKICESAVSQLNLESEAGQKILEAGEEKDLACLIHNYIKCLTIKRGQGQDALEFAKGDEEVKRLFSYLAKMQSPLGKSFFDQRMASCQKFDEAIEGL